MSAQKELEFGEGETFRRLPLVRGIIVTLALGKFRSNALAFGTSLGLTTTPS